MAHRDPWDEYWRENDIAGGIFVPSCLGMSVGLGIGLSFGSLPLWANIVGFCVAVPSGMLVRYALKRSNAAYRRLEQSLEKKRAERAMTRSVVNIPDQITWASRGAVLAKSPFGQTWQAECGHVRLEVYLDTRPLRRRWRATVWVDPEDPPAWSGEYDEFENRLEVLGCGATAEEAMAEADAKAAAVARLFTGAP